MYVHGELLFPDYVAFALLAAVSTFLLSITFYSIIELFRSQWQRTEMDIFRCGDETSSGRSLVAGHGPPEPVARVRIPAAALRIFGFLSSNSFFLSGWIENKDLFCRNELKSFQKTPLQGIVRLRNRTI